MTATLGLERDLVDRAVYDRTVERFNPELAGRPEYVKGAKQILYPGMTRLT